MPGDTCRRAAVLVTVALCILWSIHRARRCPDLCAHDPCADIDRWALAQAHRDDYVVDLYRRACV